MRAAILFGADQMVWPCAISIAIEAMERAAFLTPEQRRDIFHDNAARFLRLGAPGAGR
jgi:predicted TIM-barrel fold metal-dependent hydrolase